MATRNVRPRVLEAVQELGKFTIAELCRVAGLTDRAQAYDQINKLKAKGLVEEIRTVAIGAHAPIKEFALVSVPEKRAQFAAELASYRRHSVEPLPAPATPVESGLAAVSMDDARAGVERIEQQLDRLSGRRADERRTELEVLAEEFDTAATNLDTARLEYGAAVREPANPWNAVKSRLDSARRKWTEMLQQKEQEKNWVRALKWAVSSIAGEFPDLSPAYMQRLRSNVIGLMPVMLQPMGESLIDEIEASVSSPFVPLIRYAIETEDRDLLADVTKQWAKVAGKSPQSHDWVAYNCEAAEYLRSARLRSANWLAAYDRIREGSQPRSHPGMSVYSYPAERLTSPLYLDISKKRAVSVVSPNEVGFLRVPHVVRPTLMIGSGDRVQAVDCSFMQPDEALFAYGPLANDIVFWHGSPDLRVAASLGFRGLDLHRNLNAITSSLKAGRGLIVLQGKSPELTGDLAKELEAAEVAEVSVEL